ncbi:hypothetical protein CFK37_10085 [Virgibacillus phasianinus]|uniref:Uncharacterized protein n=1 Tax=Virgibacillus phasianinus TaxID=2017483 RepID=A0A220U3B0_9BACI|nr:hypothetical protein [Virgibacillus phasianinus]ASK62472.1 hypothetical protein CFK37_10085 [Virgibacillus phasianinus]
MNDEMKSSESESDYYVEILGDTVSPSHVLYSILISIVLGLGGFLIGKQFFPLVAEDTMVNSYSLLLGIAGCVAALVLSAILFRPKRILTESQANKEDANKLLKDLQVDLDEEYEVIRKDPVTRKEMEDLQIADIFTHDEKEK